MKIDQSAAAEKSKNLLPPPPPASRYWGTTPIGDGDTLAPHLLFSSDAVEVTCRGSSSPAFPPPSICRFYVPPHQRLRSNPCRLVRSRSRWSNAGGKGWEIRGGQGGPKRGGVSSAVWDTTLPYGEIPLKKFTLSTSKSSGWCAASTLRPVIDSMPACSRRFSSAQSSESAMATR